MSIKVKYRRTADNGICLLDTVCVCNFTHDIIIISDIQPKCIYIFTYYCGAYTQYALTSTECSDIFRNLQFGKKKKRKNTDSLQCGPFCFQKSNKVDVFFCSVKLFKCKRETITIKKNIQTTLFIEALCIHAELQQCASTLCRRSREIKRT